MSRGIVLALTGGIGGAKLALGLAKALPADELVVVANTGDDFEHLGLHISPDVDTVLYTLARINNPQTGWGQAEESWRCMDMLEVLGGETWFRLGDKDLAVHLYRTGRLRDGASLSEVTDELRRRLGIGPLVLPMSDDPVRTQVETEHGLMPFQHYFVRARCEPEVTAVHFAGGAQARATPRLASLLHDGSLDAIVLCPSNPFLSIGPMLAISEVRSGIEEARAPVIAVSPIVAGRALKGPAAKLMAGFGLPVSAAAVADHYRDLIDGFVLDTQDAGQRESIEASGIPCAVTNTVMETLGDRTLLAETVVEFARRLSACGTRGR